MGWETEITRMVRFLISDLDAVSYSDSRLEETILVAAQLLLNTIDFDRQYLVEVDCLSLSPDPTQTSPKDDFFINALVLKTTCIILGSEAKTLAAQSYRIKDGPSSIDIGASYQATKELYKNMCDKLDKMILDYKAGNSIAGHAIITPYTQEGVSQGHPIRNYFY
jgi:hypothetical protein